MGEGDWPALTLRVRWGVVAGAVRYYWGMAKLADMHREMERVPLGYFVTVRTYGTFLHGDERGAVDRDHRTFGEERVEENAARKESERGRMRFEAMVFTGEMAEVVERTIREVCGKRGWELFAVAVRSNHFHAVVGARVSAERVMNDLKAWGTRRLRESGLVDGERTVWAQHGSTPHLWTEEDVRDAVEYVEERQGGPLR